MMWIARALLVSTLVLVAASARADICPLEGEAPLPAIVMQRGPASQEKAANTLVRKLASWLDTPAWSRSDEPVETLVALVAAIRAAPWHVPARATLITLVSDASLVGLRDDPACRAVHRAWLVASLEQAYDAALGGCLSCWAIISRWVEGGGIVALSYAQDAVVPPIVARIARGPEGPLSDAARGVVDWLLDDVDGGLARGEAFVDPKKVVRVADRRLAGRDALERWWRSGDGDAPGERWLGTWRRPTAWVCAARCCQFASPQVDRFDTKLVQMCFDRDYHLDALVVTR